MSNPIGLPASTGPPGTATLVMWMSAHWTVAVPPSPLLPSLLAGSLLAVADAKLSSLPQSSLVVGPLTV